MVPIGFYRARALKDSADFGNSTEKGTPFVRIDFEIADGEHKGQVLPWDGYFTGEALARTIESMQSCGCTFPDNDITNLEGLGSNEVRIEVEHQTYTNKNSEQKTFARVAWVNSLTRGINPEAKMDEANKAAFKQRMMGQLIAVKQAKSATNGGDGGAQQPAGEKIPF